MSKTINSSNKKNNHRQVYIKHYGPIPKDSDGRTYDIHHVDGNHNNNDPSNLKAVTIQEHYNIHYAQDDYVACLRLSIRLNMTPEELSEIARKAAFKRIEEGTHNFQNSDSARNNAIRRVEDGTHPFLGGEMQRRTQKEIVKNGNHHLLSGSACHIAALERVKNGTHNLIGLQQKRLANGTHQNLKIHTCPCCGKIGKGPAMMKYHFDRCKFKCD